MRSQEVAELAGVTVRTLRHYHQIGILPEPPRLSNGYRSYDLATIGRLLRIRHLHDLGVPLHQVEEMLESTADPDLLDEIERRLTEAIHRLQEQRRQVSRLRRTGERADVPEGFAELLALYPADGSGGVLHELDQDALLVIARVVGPDNLNRQGLSDLAEALRPFMDDAALVAASGELEGLSGDAPQAEVRRVTDLMVAALEPVLARLAHSPTGRAIARTPADRWPDPAEDGRLNPAQAEVVGRVAEMLARYGPD